MDQDLKNLMAQPNDHFHAPLQPTFSSDQIPENISDLPSLNPEAFLQDIENMSSELRSMGLCDGKGANNQGGTLETPDVSMEQSKHSFRMNNLNSMEQSKPSPKMNDLNKF